MIKSSPAQKSQYSTRADDKHEVLSGAEAGFGCLDMIKSSNTDTKDTGISTS